MVKVASVTWIPSLARKLPYTLGVTEKEKKKKWRTMVTDLQQVSMGKGVI